MEKTRHQNGFAAWFLEGGEYIDNGRSTPGEPQS
jgi:hypothetical protein